MTTSMRAVQISIVVICFLFLCIFHLLDQTPSHLTVPTAGSTLKVNIKKREVESLPDAAIDSGIGISPNKTSKPLVRETSSQSSTSTTIPSTTSSAASTTTSSAASTTTSSAAFTTTSPKTTASRQQEINILNKWNIILKSELEAKRGVIKFLTKHVINEHNFEYVRNPVNACVETKPEILFAVLSAPGNFELRERMRNGDIGEFARTTMNGAKLLFFTGAFACNENATKLQTRLSDEYHDYGDIVQDDFPDIFQNLRLKAVSLLKWTFTYCSDVKYVVRMDDDIVVNVPNIVKVMVTKSQQYPNFIVGSIRADWQFSRRRSIPLKPEEDYSNSTFPRFVLGELQGYPLSTVSLLYHAAIRAKPIVLEDVFITGICAKSVDVPLLSDSEFVFRHKPIKTKD